MSTDADQYDLLRSSTADELAPLSGRVDGDERTAMLREVLTTIVATVTEVSAEHRRAASTAFREVGAR